jgi:two-component system CheB/CheR fusion protein
MKRSRDQAAGVHKAGNKLDPGSAVDLQAADSGVEVKRSFSIVGIGASAGGLEALEVFFKQTPADSGLAYVVVQHLDPTHSDMLAELLQRHTAMPVVRIHDGMVVKPDQVHVIPPNRDLSILHGVLYLLEHSAAVGPRLPIDFFFRSLAEDWRERSVGVILSGMGTDGTAGLRSVKQRCGAVFAQDPKSAKFDSMVQSAIHAGLADVVAPVEELPGRILEYVRHATFSKAVPADQESGDGDAGGMEKVLILLRRQSGHDFSVYKRSTLWRRIERRMNLHHFSAVRDYVRHLRENPQELELLFKEMLIGVTEFFRDPVVWDRLENEVIPDLIRARPDGGVLRAWVAGCSTGEEAYSLAIAFRDAVVAVNPPNRMSLQVFATDLDKDAIDRARCGVYPADISKDVSEVRLSRYFSREDNGCFRVCKDIREMVVFAQQNMVSDAPFTKLDILCCRNLLIYLCADLQKKLLPLFHYCLNPGGVLVLGNAETIGQATDLFAALGGKERLYRRLETSAPLERMHFPIAFSHVPGRAGSGATPGLAQGAPVPDLQLLANDFLLRNYAPVAVLVSEAGDILYLNGRTGPYLEPAAGKANWNIFAMAREELNHVLFEMFRRALRKKQVVAEKSVKVATQTVARFVDVTVHPITEPVPLQGMVMVVFTETSGERTRDTVQPAGSQDSRLVGMARDLRHSQEELQVLREEMQTTGEELKSSNEELQSANEELQSMNEELTTSKEEMQAMNEELQVVNQDLMIKLQDLSRTNNDMKNLLSSTDTATLFLDNELNVRWFAPQTADIIHLIPGDVGRPITDIVSRLDYPALAQDIREVLRTLEPLKKEIPSSGGRWFSIRIIPYRTKESMIDGLVITFLDVSDSRKLAVELAECRSLLATLQSQNPD